MKSFFSKTLMVSVSLLGLVACDLPGSLTANQNVNLIDKKGHVVPLQAGHTYNAAISKDDGMLQIKINVNGNDQKVKVAAPPGQTVPQEQGEMFVTAAQSGQPVDLHGIVDTKYDRGPEQWGQESCYVPMNVQVCGNVYVPDPNGGHNEYQCRWETREIPGRADVQFYNQRTTTTGQIHMYNPGTKVMAAQFYGQDSHVDQIVTWRGACRPDYYPQQ